MCRGRWVLACIGCISIVPLLAASAAAHPAKIPDQTWAYQTWYRGKLHEKVDKTFTVPGGTAPQKHETWYRFNTIEVETFKYRKGRVTSTSKLWVYVLGFASRTEYHFEQNKPLVEQYLCGIRSVPTPVTNKTIFGSTVQPILRSQNPLVQVSWSIPIPLAQNTVGVKWQVSGSKKCSPQGDYTPGAIGYIDPKVPDEVDEAYNGSARIPYFQIEKVSQISEWDKDFKIHLAESKVVQGTPTSAAFDLDAEVGFRALLDNTLDEKKWDQNKIGALLEKSAFDLLRNTNIEIGYNPPPTVVLVPGMGVGDVRLDVNATIVPKASPLRRSSSVAAKETLIATASKHLARDEPFFLKFALTPAGKALMAKKPATIKGHLVLKLKPKGSTKWLTRSASGTWPRLAP